METFEDRVVYAWDDGWGEEHWWVDCVKFIDGAPQIGEDWFQRAQGAGTPPKHETDCWTGEELEQEVPYDSKVRSRNIILFGGDDATIEEIPVTFEYHLAMQNPYHGHTYWMAAHAIGKEGA